MDFGFTPEEEKLRQEVHDFLRKEVTPELIAEVVEYSGGAGPVHGRRIIQKMGARGWLCPTWPKEYGGINSSEMVGFIIRDEMTYAGAPVSLVGATMAGPTILRLGSDELKKEYLPRIARGEIEMALGYTEPQAGSDLAALELRAEDMTEAQATAKGEVEAEDKGDYFLLNGQKMFNTHAHFADYHWLGARTDTTTPKRHRGISLMVVDLKSPGITIRNMTTIAGWKTNEVFYDNVKVPKKNLVGEKNKGFYYIMTALDFERMFPVGSFRRIFDELIEYTKETKRDGKLLSQDPVIRQKLAEMAIELELSSLLYYQLAYILDKGEVPNYQSSMQKMFATETAHRLADIATQIIGPLGQLQSGSKWAPLHGEAELHYRWGFIETVYAGTSEIMRNIIALRGLGLPLG
jgi:hypothetical protein